ncbi:MAG TPA: trypsin-like peptidase domain-containing protein [Gaiellaceae bacterium]|nr:trypsin-like peptidase domain-containing protein [Gaiellaceae bacterium]
MRPLAVTVLALGAAVVGGALVYLLGPGRDDGGSARPARVVVGEIDAGAAAASAPLTGQGFNPERIYAARAPGVVTLYTYFGGAPPAEHAAQGSGFVVSPDGYILTSAHVITTAGQGTDAPTRGARDVYVAFADGDRVEAQMVGWDLFDDVGVVRVDPRKHMLRPIALGDSDALRVGAAVAAIGSPFGNRGSLSVGVVSAVGRSIPSLTSAYYVSDAIQTDAPITHGNSGGPLLDASGDAVGINAQIRTDTGGGEGVGFAVPINAAKRSLRQLIASGHVRYPYVGIETGDLTPTLARHLGVAVKRGALVQTVSPDTPGAAAGLRAGNRTEFFNGVEIRPGGDVLTAIGGLPVRSSSDVARVLVEHFHPGQVVAFSIVRGNHRQTLKVKLALRPAVPDASP